MDRTKLEGLTRDDLVRMAEEREIPRARMLTVDELIAALTGDASLDPGGRRGWFGRARDLLTSVIDRGRTEPAPRGREGQTRIPSAPPPLPTVTLAEIYAAQGHLERAIATLDQVLTKNPEQPEAARLRERYTEQLRKVRPSAPPPVVELTPEPLDGSSSSGPSASASGQTSAAPTAAADATATTAAIGEAKAVPATVEAATDAAVADVPADDDTLEPALIEVDEVVGLAVDASTVYLYWEVRPATLAAARAKNEHGALVVRMLTVTPAGNGPVKDERDTRVDALSGELFVRGLPAGSQVRYSIGYRVPASGEGDVRFEPFAVGVELSTPRSGPVADTATQFRRWSDAGTPALGRPSTMQGRAFPGGSANGPAGASYDRSESALAGDPDIDALGARFPAGVWVDPRGRLVRVAERSSDGTKLVGEITSRLPGSSELFRTHAVWSLRTGPSSDRRVP